jgi:hypothetical protein
MGSMELQLWTKPCERLGLCTLPAHTSQADRRDRLGRRTARAAIMRSQAHAASQRSDRRAFGGLRPAFHGHRGATAPPSATSQSSGTSTSRTANQDAAAAFSPLSQSRDFQRSCLVCLHAQ